LVIDKTPLCPAYKKIFAHIKHHLNEDEIEENMMR